ncbi:hypothetical protein [Desulfolithobacter sp.]
MTEKKRNALQVIIKGKLESHHQIHSDRGTFFANHIIVPAPDEFSFPQRFAVNARSPLGADGSLVEVLCDVRASNRRKDGQMYYNVQLWEAQP